jgi:ferredoxin-fold anticodon binding domain-containing protein
VIILIDGGQTVSGVLSEITPDYVILKSKNETVYLTADVIKALKIRL